MTITQTITHDTTAPLILVEDVGGMPGLPGKLVTSIVGRRFGCALKYHALELHIKASILVKISGSGGPPPFPSPVKNFQKCPKCKKWISSPNQDIRTSAFSPSKALLYRFYIGFLPVPESPSQ